MTPLLWVIKSWPASCAKFNALTRMVEISSQKVLVFRLCPYLLLVSQSHVEVLIACTFFVYFWWQRTQDFSRTFNFIIYQLESSDRLTVSSSLYSSNVSLIVFFICFTLSVFDNIDVLSFKTLDLVDLSVKRRNVTQEWSVFYPGLISVTFVLFVTLWFTKKKSSQHCTFGRLRLYVNRPL